MATFLVEFGGCEDSATVFLLYLELIGAARAVDEREVERRYLLITFVPIKLVVLRVAHGLPLEGDVSRGGFCDVDLCDGRGQALVLLFSFLLFSLMGCWLCCLLRHSALLRVRVRHREDGRVRHETHLLILINGLNCDCVVLALHGGRGLEPVRGLAVRRVDSIRRALAIFLGNE